MEQSARPPAALPTRVYTCTSSPVLWDNNFKSLVFLLFIYLFIYVFIYLFIIIIINNLFIQLSSCVLVCFFIICFFFLSRAGYPSSHVCTSSAVFIGFMYILKVWSLIHLFKPPPPVGTRGLRLEYVLRIPMRLEKGDWNGAVSLNNHKKTLVGALFLYFFFCLFVCSFFLLVVVVGFFFFLLGEFVSFNMYSYSTFVIVVYFIFLSGK